jgi:hypothetical protein
MNGTIYFRADHELVGRVLAEKLRRKAESRANEGSFYVVEHKKASRVRAARGLA